LKLNHFVFPIFRLSLFCWHVRYWNSKLWSFFITSFVSLWKFVIWGIQRRKLERVLGIILNDLYSFLRLSSFILRRSFMLIWFSLFSFVWGDFCRLIDRIAENMVSWTVLDSRSVYGFSFFCNIWNFEFWENFLKIN